MFWSSAKMSASRAWSSARRSLAAEFPSRVFDTPISESAILGAAVGAAMLGLRLIVEIMGVDFASVALDQIINQAANVRYESNGTLTAAITVRTQQGALPGSCAHHSQSLEAIFAHIPGLRSVFPRRPRVRSTR
jgi:pyruvate/2-oxoglutarate/acetoin dehydrogenase E1 component